MQMAKGLLRIVLLSTAIVGGILIGGTVVAVKGVDRLGINSRISFIEKLYDRGDMEYPIRGTRRCGESFFVLFGNGARIDENAELDYR